MIADATKFVRQRNTFRRPSHLPSSRLLLAKRSCNLSANIQSQDQFCLALQIEHGVRHRDIRSETQSRSIHSDQSIVLLPIHKLDRMEDFSLSLVPSRSERVGAKAFPCGVFGIVQRRHPRWHDILLVFAHVRGQYFSRATPSASSVAGHGFYDAMRACRHTSTAASRFSSNTSASGSGSAYTEKCCRTVGKSGKPFQLSWSNVSVGVTSQSSTYAPKGAN